MMKHIRAFCFSLTLVVSGFALHAQSVQHGLVQEYHGSESKTPLKNVSVSAANASAVISDDKGEFTLNFRTLHAGDAIQFRRVELSGYEVMNQEALEAARVARDFNDNANLLRPQDARTEGSNPNTSLNGKPSTLNIVMIKREALLKLRDGYRSVAAQRYEKQLKASEEEIERLKQEGKLAEEQYNERMNALEEEYEEKLSKLETYIDKFARIDLSDLDQDEQQIIDLVQAGNFDEALDLYDRQNLADRLRQSREDQKKLTAMRDQLDEAARQKAVENQRLRASIDRQVTLLYMAGGEENYKKAHNVLQQTFLADTTDWEARRTLALSFQQFGMLEEQISLLKSGFEIEKDDFAKGMIALELTDPYWNLGEYEESYHCALLADSLMTPMMESNPEVLSRALPDWSYRKLMYLRNDAYKSSAAVLDRVRQHWSPDTLNAKSLYAYSTLLKEMSEAYSYMQNHEQSVWCASESVQLGTMLSRLKPFAGDMYIVYSKACSTYLLEGLREEAVAAARNSINELSGFLEKGGALFYYTNSVLACYSLMEALVPAEEYLLADSVMQVASKYKVFEHASESHDIVVKLYMALCHYYHAQVLLNLEKTEDAKRLAENSFVELNALEEGAALLEFLQPEMEARIALAEGRLKEAVDACQKAIDVCAATYEESQDAWDGDTLCRYYILMSDIYKASGNKSKSVKSLKQAEKHSAFEGSRQLIEKRK